MKKKDAHIDVNALSDREILALSVKQPRYFEELVKRYERQFIRKAISVLRNDEDAYDAVQETFVRIYVAANRFKEHEGASFSSWAYTVLVNQCYTLYKKRERASYVSFESEPELAESVADTSGNDDIETRFAKDRLLGLISKLPKLLRSVVEAHFIQGLPQKAIAEREGVSNGVIRTRVHRAKKELKKLDMQNEYI